MESISKEKKILVAYSSQTGKTKKVAEAIYDAIPQPKEIKPIKDVDSLKDYGLSFLGFPVHAEGPDKKAKEFLQEHVKDKTIALFITHMAPEESPELPEWIQKFREAAVGARIIDVFNCQGQASRLVKTIMRLSLNSKYRERARSDTSKGQPDFQRLERAKEFANNVMTRVILRRVL